MLNFHLYMAQRAVEWSLLTSLLGSEGIWPKGSRMRQVFADEWIAWVLRAWKWQPVWDGSLSGIVEAVVEWQRAAAGDKIM